MPLIITSTFAGKPGAEVPPGTAPEWVDWAIDKGYARELPKRRSFYESFALFAGTGEGIDESLFTEYSQAVIPDDV